MNKPYTLKSRLLRMSLASSALLLPLLLAGAANADVAYLRSQVGQP